MKKLKTFAALLVLVAIPFVSVNAYDMKNVVAYPVPFNPKKDTMQLGEPDPSTYLNGVPVEAVIYDINGDVVRTLSGTGPRLSWNGRDGNGRYVKPGLYLIKITAEDPSTGDYGKKIIRILVDY